MPDRRTDTNQVHRCVAVGISDDGGQAISRFMARFARRQQEPANIVDAGQTAWKTRARSVPERS